MITEGKIKQGMEERCAKREKERENDRKINADSKQQKKRRKETNK